PTGASQTWPMTPASSIASWAADWARLSPSTGQPLGRIQRRVERVVTMPAAGLIAALFYLIATAFKLS
ncbi:MAG TPA: hypothetical protein VLL04_14400, partial [Rhizomicrobium sp.]|nr:hypothetical protein [Rhizomicrobium sp.]